MSKHLVKRMLPLAIALILQLVAAAQPATPQYEQAECWWSGSNGNTGSDVDVFYVLPTCVGAWQDFQYTTTHCSRVSTR